MRRRSHLSTFICKESAFFYLILSLCSLCIGCPDATQVGQICADEISELNDVCPVGTSAMLRTEASGSCEGSGSANFLSESGELSGSCESVGSCEFVCMVAPDRCDCGVQSFTNDEVICKPCAACGDGVCNESETPEDCPRDCASMCESGRVRCSGEAREECSLQGAWESLPCPEGEVCRDIDGVSTCGVVCESGRVRCSGEAREECSLQGFWESLPCPEGEQCRDIDGVSTCGVVCESGRVRCSGEAREECSLQGAWESLPCPEGEVCRDIDGVSTCGGVCQPNEQRCNGEDRQQCSARGDWETLSCGEGERCIEDMGVVRCLGVCEQGSVRCNGELRQECSLQGQWEDISCPDEHRCVQEEGEVECQLIPSCGELNSMRCVDGVRETCTADGLWMVRPCLENQRCDDLSGEGLCVDCTEQWWFDHDRDGFGDPNEQVTACVQPDQYVMAGGEEDCNDQLNRVNPDQSELCDDIDNDCDQQVDEGRDTSCGIGELCEDSTDCSTRVCDIEFGICVSFNLIVIGGGHGIQGSSTSQEISEYPAHDVRISSAFLMQRYEVTNADWNTLFDQNPSSDLSANVPVQNVSWYDTLAYANALSEQEGIDFCYDLEGCVGTVGVDYTCPETLETSRWITGCRGYRLPTEAEWEFSSNGGRRGWFAGHWSDIAPQRGDIALDDALDPIGWYVENSTNSFGRLRPHEVGQKDNEHGFQIQLNQLYDMHGNVAEWTWDTYLEEAYPQRLISCVEDQDCGEGECDPNGFCTTEVLNPVLSSVELTPTPHVIRGGAYDSEAFDCRHASRRGASQRAHNIGFRLVRGMIQ